MVGAPSLLIEGMTTALKPITATAFEPYGQVMSTLGADPLVINEGYAQRFNKLAKTQIDPAINTDAEIALFVAKARALPYTIKMLERHPYTTQAFFPLEPHQWIVIVSNEAVPTAQGIKAFTVPGDQGVQYHRGIWHFPLFVCADSQRFIVVDGGQNSQNLEEYVLPQPIVIA